MSFLDIKDSAKRATLVKEYVTAKKTVKKHNMANREMKLVIGDELQTLFHPIVNATKQAAEEFSPMKKTFTFMELWQLNMSMLDHHRVKLLILPLVSARQMGN